MLDPVTLEVVASCEVAEPSIARLSADGDTVYVVGDHSLLRARWDGTDLVADAAFAARYRTMPGQTHGWDAVLALGAAWFLDDGAGAERYAGTFRGVGTNTAPLHLVRVDLDTAEVQLTEVCGRPGGLIANPPLVDEQRRIVVGYDSGNAVMAAFDIADDGSLTRAGASTRTTATCSRSAATFGSPAIPATPSRADALVGEVPRWGWEQRCQGPGAKGLRTRAWAWVALGPGGCPDGWARSLLIRRDPDAESDGDEQYAYFLCYHRRGTTLSELIGVAGRRWGSRKPSRSPSPRPGSTSTRSAAGPPGTATRSCPCSPRRSSPSPAPASRQTPPPGRRADPVHLQRDPPATGNDRSPRRSGNPVRPAVVMLAAPPPSPRGTVPLPAPRRTARPPQPQDDHRLRDLKIN